MKVLIDIEIDGTGEATPEELKGAYKLFVEEMLDFSASNVKVLSVESETEDIRDGFHSFKELYDHRIELFIALAKMHYEAWENAEQSSMPWKSKKHSDGSEWEGWFVAGFNHEAGKQITYHLPMSRWHDLLAKELDKAPEWDGHTPADVLDRLKLL